jgi:bacillithiol system protein YtxJ
MAYEEMERVDAEVHVVDVSEQRTLSKDVQARTGIRHESPQVFVMAGGAVQWHASHGRIRKDAVGDAIQQAQPSPGG